MTSGPAAPGESHPVCYRHPSRETYVRCTRCDRPICPDCMKAASVGHQCPECVAEGRRTQRPVRTAFGGDPQRRCPGTSRSALIALNVILFVASIVSAKTSGAAVGGSGIGGLLGSTTPLTDRLSVFGEVGCQRSQGGVGIGPAMHCVAGVVRRRVLPPLHRHVHALRPAAPALNMWALWVLGRPLEAMFGPCRFLALYLVCGLGGNVAVYVFSPDASERRRVDRDLRPVRRVLLRAEKAESERPVAHTGADHQLGDHVRRRGPSSRSPGTSAA